MRLSRLEEKEEEISFDTIECLPNEILFHIFEYASGSGRWEDIKTFCALRQVSSKWRDAADASILKLFWSQLKILNYPELKSLITETEASFEQTLCAHPMTGSPLSLSSSDDGYIPSQSPDYFAQFFHLSLMFNHIGPPIRKSDVMLRPQAYLHIQAEFNASLEKLWAEIRPQFHFPNEQNPISCEAIREWLHAPQHAEQIGLIVNLHLKQLDLKVLPCEIYHFARLNELNLYHANLSYIPYAIGNLTQLTTLSLYDNQLAALPDTIGNLTQLTWLSLSTNKLTFLPGSIGNLTRLTELYLHENDLDSIPESIGNLTNLIALSLSENQLETVPDTLGNLRRLKSLSLSSNKLAAIPYAITLLPPTTAIQLQDNPCTDKGF